MLKTIKDSPTVKQLSDELGIDYASLLKGKQANSEKYSLYKEVWFYRKIRDSYMPSFKVKNIKPVELAVEFCKTRSNMSELRKKGTPLFDIYCEVYIFRKILCGVTNTLRDNELIIEK